MVDILYNLTQLPNKIIVHLKDGTQSSAPFLPLLSNSRTSLVFLPTLAITLAL